jgi:hypothetical protein
MLAPCERASLAWILRQIVAAARPRGCFSPRCGSRVLRQYVLSAITTSTQAIESEFCISPRSRVSSS